MGSKIVSLVGLKGFVMAVNPIFDRNAGFDLAGGETVTVDGSNGVSEAGGDPLLLALLLLLLLLLHVSNLGL